MSVAVLLVEGMTCDHCVHAVVEQLMTLDGVSAADVALEPGAASAVTVIAEPLPTGAELAAAIEAAGYQVIGA